MAEMEITPETMVERVARAIVERRHGRGAPVYGENLADARAAIAAMREPTEAQYEALSATDKMWRELNSTTVWQTYIDAALKDHPHG